MQRVIAAAGLDRKYKISGGMRNNRKSDNDVNENVCKMEET